MKFQRVEPCKGSSEWKYRTSTPMCWQHTNEVSKGMQWQCTYGIFVVSLTFLDCWPARHGSFLCKRNLAEILVKNCTNWDQGSEIRFMKNSFYQCQQSSSHALSEYSTMNTVTCNILICTLELSNIDDVHKKKSHKHKKQYQKRFGAFDLFNFFFGGWLYCLCCFFFLCTSSLATLSHWKNKTASLSTTTSSSSPTPSHHEHHYYTCCYVFLWSVGAVE